MRTQSTSWIRALLLVLLVASAGCEFGGVIEAEIDSDGIELVDSPTTDESFATVFLDLPSGYCTGTALTDRWIITAAHCIEDYAGGTSRSMKVCSGTCDVNLPDSSRDILYHGGAQYFPHPDYDPGWTGVDASDDIGLILLSGSGMSGGPRGRIYADDDEPWYNPDPYHSVPIEDRTFSAIGYGRGSDPGGAGCSHDSSLTLGVKRISEDIYFLARDYPAESIQTGGSGHGICFGDSGGPWLFERSGKYLAFALSSYIEDFAWWDDAHGTLIPPKWSWIVDTASSAGMPIECQAYTADDTRYRMCEDNPVFVRLDAELGVLTFPMVIGSNSYASRGKYIHVPNGGGTNGKMRYTFSVPRGGFYRIWGRVLAPSSADDSFYVSMDSGTAIYWDTPTTPSSTWVWDAVNQVGVADPVVFELAAGTHTIEIRQREDGTSLDRLIVTSSAIFQPWEVWLEAEHGGLTWPMRVALSPAGQFIWVPNGGGTGGSAAYSFGIQPPGKYAIWGLTRAASGGDNSFFVTVDEGDRLLWDTPVTGDWVWDQVSHRYAGDALFWLEGGWHGLFIEQREDGTGLNRLLVTNDLGFVPTYTPMGFIVY